MAFHHPINQVNQVIGGVGRGGQGAFDSLFHHGSPRFSQYITSLAESPKAEDRTVQN
jgi:hypothetical protein